ncbi:hypothetical protein [uncultured Serinicoccus sp.]|uniref:hypothetical protein n=1 Tax=uncultured Serinicoccus sp. TaxID=735514 RepID=UPI002603037D|nr:hypothetical protein [uncultured Serinicoccus sp.]
MTRSPVPNRRSVLGAAGVLGAMLLFAATVGAAIHTSGTTFVWSVNMISDLGDGACRPRDGRWICSPGAAAFNLGLLLSGVLLGVAALCLSARWGRWLAGSVSVMGLGLVVAAVFPAGDTGAVHLAGVILALVVPAGGLLLSAVRPETPWLGRGRRARGTLATVALLFCAENRIPPALVQEGTGQIVIVSCLLLALLVESVRVLVSRSGSAGQPVSRSAGGSAATGSPSP